MKKLLLFLFVIFATSVSGLRSNTTSYVLDFVVASGAISDENTASYNFSSTLGEILIGNDTHTSYGVWYGLQFHYELEEVTTTTTTVPAEEEEEEEEEPEDDPSSPIYDDDEYIFPDDDNETIDINESEMDSLILKLKEILLKPDEDKTATEVWTELLESEGLMNKWRSLKPVFQVLSAYAVYMICLFSTYMGVVMYRESKKKKQEKPPVFL